LLPRSSDDGAARISRKQRDGEWRITAATAIA
jgi:hypothetical protein